MSYLQSLGMLPLIDSAVQEGRGVVGAVLGQTYNVYRLTSSSNGSIIGATPLYSNYPAFIDEKAPKKLLENTTFDLLAFEAKVDNRPLLPGDIFVEVGYKSDGGIWVFAGGRPIHPNVFIRAETRSFLSRPNSEAGTATQQPQSGAVLQTGYGGTRIGVEKYLTLTNGLYNFSATATVGATVPVGIQPLNRVRDGQIPKHVPTRQYRTHHLIYIPPIDGEILDVQDRVNASGGATAERFEVMEIHTTGSTGLIGNICICEKLAA